MREIKEELEKIKLVAAIIDPIARYFWKISFSIGEMVPSHIKWNDFCKQFCNYFQFEFQRDDLSSSLSENPSEEELKRANRLAFEQFAKNYPDYPLLKEEKRRRLLTQVLFKLESLIKEKDDVQIDKFGIVCDTCNLFKEDGPQQV